MEWLPLYEQKDLGFGHNKIFKHYPQWKISKVNSGHKNHRLQISVGFVNLRNRPIWKRHSLRSINHRHTRDHNNNPKGRIFFTVGAAELYNFRNQAPYVIERFLRHGFLNVNLTNSGMNLTATFYEKGHE